MLVFLFCFSLVSCGENAEHPTEIKYSASNEALYFHTSCTTVTGSKKGWNFQIEDESILQNSDGSGEVLDDNFLFIKRQIRRETLIFKPIAEGKTKLTFSLSGFILSETKYEYDVTVTKDSFGKLIMKVEKSEP